MSTAVATDIVLSVQGLGIQYKIGTEWRDAVKDVSFSIAEGKTFGLVGESGCGKSTVAMAAVAYLARNARISSGSVTFEGRELTTMSQDDLRDIWVGGISMVYQDPGTALNPALRIGRQVAEVFELMGVPRSEWDDRVGAVLKRVQIADPHQVVRRYPHQLSGGMLQRVVIAMAIAAEPKLLILDEPTTGLDATVEAEVLDLVRELREEIGTAVMFISHDLSVIRKMCDRAAVLYAGRVVAEGPAEAMFSSPTHPYTVGLLRSLPSSQDSGNVRSALDTIAGVLPDLGSDIAGCVYADRCPIVQEVCRTTPPPAVQLDGDRTAWCHFPELGPDIPRTETEELPESQTGDVLLELRKVSKTFMQDGAPVYAVADVDLTIHKGETLALVGESGSGKSTLAKVILGVHQPDEGSIMRLSGEDLPGQLEDRSEHELRAIQMVFQNPDSALNRRHSVRRIVGRAISRLRGHKGDVSTQVIELLESVKFRQQLVSVRPQQLSGGLKQRVAIARAFAGSPELVVCDEPTSALDVSVQAAILNLLNKLQADEQVSYLFISHDLGVVRYIADRVAVMYVGRLMQEGSVEEVFAGPHHPYTEALLSASPHSDGMERIKLEGEIPSASNPPSGCVFQTRCPRKIGEICETVEPELVEISAGLSFRCHIPPDEL